MLTNGLSMSNDFAVTVETTDNSGSTPEVVAVRCVNRITGISHNAPPAIKDQAHASSKQSAAIISTYMHQAIQRDRITVYNAIRDSGNPKLAEYIRRM